MKTTFLKKTYNEGPEVYYAIDSDKIQEMELWGTYDQYGQSIGHENAGDYHPENCYSDAKIHLEFALTERFGKEFELSGVEIETINDKDPEGDLTEYKNFIDEWIKENQTLTKCKGFTYWNGHNWQSVIVENPDADSEYEVIDDENLIAELTKALEEKTFEQESFGKKLYEGNGYNIEVSQFASAWWEYAITSEED